MMVLGRICLVLDQHLNTEGILAAPDFTLKSTAVTFSNIVWLTKFMLVKLLKRFVTGIHSPMVVDIAMYSASVEEEQFPLQHSLDCQMTGKLAY